MELPPVKLDYLKALTDDTGLLQFSKLSVPCRKDGYTTDDNTRAIIACTKYLECYGDSNVKKLLDIYLSLLLYMQRNDGKMHNCLSYNRQYLDDVGSEECIGNTIWACGYIQDSSLSSETKLVAKEIFDKALPWAVKSTWPRVKALTLNGLFHYQRAYQNDSNSTTLIRLLGDQLLELYNQQASPGWNWFEDSLTYSNGRLPEALFLAYESTGETKYLQTALQSFDFLFNIQNIDNIFVPIGNNGWCQKGKERAIYDQQPIEACCMVDAAVAAFRCTQQQVYSNVAHLAFEWFLGKNLNKISLYEETNGSCCDGLTPYGLNKNKGAESNIAYLLARLNITDLTLKSKNLLFAMNPQ